MGKTRRMRLVAFLKTGPTAHHHGMWRHPETDNDFLDPAWYEHVARVLEKGGSTACSSPTRSASSTIIAATSTPS